MTEFGRTALELGTPGFLINLDPMSMILTHPLQDPVLRTLYTKCHGTASINHCQVTGGLYQRGRRPHNFKVKVTKGGHAAQEDQGGDPEVAEAGVEQQVGALDGRLERDRFAAGRSNRPPAGLHKRPPGRHHALSSSCCSSQCFLEVRGP